MYSNHALLQTFILSLQKFLFKQKRIKFIICEHNWVEERNYESKETDHDREEQKWIFGQLFLVLVQNDDLKEQMDCELGQILAKERNYTHKFAKYELLAKNGNAIVDTEAVKDGC